MKNKVYALLRSGEEETIYTKHRTLYNFKYIGDVFMIMAGDTWVIETSTAFDFLTVG